ncbi:MAG: hypothetical protein HY735_08140 [Verrucomicrobia bacterium]|nr:hypothetical protein [Verrucomicrobiota bacterium]
MPLASGTATVAQLQLHCLSLRFKPATTSANGLNYTLDLTTETSGTTSSNGELAPLPSGGASSHGSFFRLTGDVFFEPVVGAIFLNVPLSTDTNTNGVPDLFEVDLAVGNMTSSGSFESADQSGKISAIWNRAADSKDGVCRLTLDAYSLTFTNSFEVQEFAGTLQYRNVAGETNVSASVNLSQKAQPAVKLTGTAIFTKEGSGRLSVQPGVWRNQEARNFTYQSIDELERAGSKFTAPFFFRDGDLSTAVEDFVSWTLRISDPNDANRNAIPDLADEGGNRLPPLLSLNRSGTNLLLSISGEIGKLHQVETIAALELRNWSLVTSVTLTNDPQTVVLRAPTNRSRTAFWRVKTPQ